MTRGLLKRVGAAGLALCLGLSALPAPRLRAQTDQTTTAQLLGKAHALEVRGRMDMAKQVWQQVLLGDPNNAAALAGMARAAKSAGDQAGAQLYLGKLRAINPSDPNIARIEAMGTAQDESGKLQEAGRLAQAGQPARAMALLREVYGDNPPPGDAALSYYQTEAGTDEGRPQAIAGLRGMADKYPEDPRYQVALGKILTYNPRTRAEGRKLLEKHPLDPDAQEGLRQSLVWDAQSPATAPEIRDYLKRHQDPALAKALTDAEAQARAANGGQAPTPPPTPAQQAAQAAARVRGTEEQKAYDALNAKRFDDADARFKALLAKDAGDAQAAAGLGYVRMNQGNFGAAISFFEQSEQNGNRDANVTKALRDARFYLTMQAANAALADNQDAVAEQQFQAALRVKPNEPTALLGLGGTMLKEQQFEAALPVLSAAVRVSPTDRSAWRGLLAAEFGAGRYNEVLATDRRIPTRVRAALESDPDYLRTLAATDQATGRTADAQRILESALALPVARGSGTGRSDEQLQYAGLLSSANRQAQAVVLYQQVLAADPANSTAWVGLVTDEHQLNQDPDAYAAIRSMPPDVYQTALKDAGFEGAVAAVYESQGHEDMAQAVLETFLAAEQARGVRPPTGTAVQLAGIYLRAGNSAAAYPLYRSILQGNPSDATAWNGLLGALHASGRDQEALAEVQQIPPAVRTQLESNPAYLQTVASVYAGLGEPQQAILFFSRVQQRYAAQHLPTPGDVDVQEGWLLYNSGNDAALLRHLLILGGRADLTDTQRETVQTIWANFALRRANQATAAGNPRLALAILNSAAHTFPGNGPVLRALGSGYASAGQAREAVEIFRAQNLNMGTASDYKAAVGAALSANDLKDAEVWLRFGLNQYPGDPQLLNLAGRFEAARGNSTLAAEYYRAALRAMPTPDSGSQLAMELAQKAPQLPGRATGGPTQPQDLATLLSQPSGPATASRGAQPAPLSPRPYLPSYKSGTGTAPVVLDGGAQGGMSPGPQSYSAPSPRSPAAGAYGTVGYGQAGYGQVGYGAAGFGSSTLPATAPTGIVPPATAPASPGTGYLYGGTGVSGALSGPDMGGYPAADPQAAAPPGTGRSGRIRRPSAEQGLPQARLRSGAGSEEGNAGAVAARVDGIASTVRRLHSARATEAKFGPYVVYNPDAGTPRFAGAPTLLGDGVVRRGSRGGRPNARMKDGRLLVRSGAGGNLRAVRFQTVQTLSQTPTGAEPTPAPRGQVVYSPSYGSARGAKKLSLSSGQADAQAGHGSSAYSSPASGPAALGPVLLSPRPAATRRRATPASSASQTATSGAAAAPVRRRGVKQPTEAVLRARAAAIRANQEGAAGQMTGVSAPPTEIYGVAVPQTRLQNAQYTVTQPYSAAQQQGGAAQTGQVPQAGATRGAASARSGQAAGQPAAQGSGTRSSPQAGSGQGGSAVGTYVQGGYAQGGYVQGGVPPAAAYPQQGSGGTSTGQSAGSAATGSMGTGQQYPQPGTRSNPRSVQQRRAGAKRRSASAPDPVPAPQAPLRYPNVPQPFENPGPPQVSAPYPLSQPPTDYQLEQRNLPPLRGYFDPRTDAKTPLTERQQTELDLAQIEGSYSPWLGGGVLGRTRSGTAGVDRLTVLEVPFEGSTTFGDGYRFTVLPKAVFLNSGQLQSSFTGGGPVLGTFPASFTAPPAQQFVSGIGGEVQLAGNSWALAAGTTPFEFAVSNVIGRARWRPGNGHFTLYGGRDAVEETQLSYAGLHDPGTATATFAGNTWGGVVQTGGGVRFDLGDEHSGLYMQVEGGALTGFHVLGNTKFDGIAGAYFRVKQWPQFGSINVGGALYGEHFGYNERGETFGLGGYFSPSAYFLAAVPVTFAGHHGTDFHYTVTGSMGVQTFQEAAEAYFPLDPALQATAPCPVSTPQCGLAVNTNTGFNFSVDSEVAYRVTENWYVGGTLSANNTNNYNTVSGGFFARYTFRPQYPTGDTPTGLFPMEGFRPVRVP